MVKVLIRVIAVTFTKMCLVGPIMECVYVRIKDQSMLFMSCAEVPFSLQPGRGAGVLAAVSLL